MMFSIHLWLHWFVGSFLYCVHNGYLQAHASIFRVIFYGHVFFPIFFICIFSFQQDEYSEDDVLSDSEDKVVEQQNTEKSKKNEKATSSTITQKTKKQGKGGAKNKQAEVAASDSEDDDVKESDSDNDDDDDEDEDDSDEVSPCRDFVHRFCVDWIRTNQRKS